MLCPIKVNSNKIELTVHISGYCVLDLLCVIGIQMVYIQIPIVLQFSRYKCLNAFKTEDYPGKIIPNSSILLLTQ